MTAEEQKKLTELENENLSLRAENETLSQDTERLTKENQSLIETNGTLLKMVDQSRHIKSQSSIDVEIENDVPQKRPDLSSFAWRYKK